MRPAACSASSRSRSAGSPTRRARARAPGRRSARSAIAVLVGRGGSRAALRSRPRAGRGRRPPCRARSRERRSIVLGLPRRSAAPPRARCGSRGRRASWRSASRAPASASRWRRALLAPGALALAVLVVDQALAVGAGAARRSSRAASRSRAHARERVGLALDCVERRWSSRRSLISAASCSRRQLGLGRLCASGRRGSSARLRAPGSGSSTTSSDPTSSSARSASILPPFQAKAASHTPPSSAAHGLWSSTATSRCRVVAMVQPQHGPHEAPPAQAAPVAGDLESLAHRLEPLDGEGRLGGRDIRDGSSHLAARLVHGTAISTHSRRSRSRMTLSVTSTWAPKYQVLNRRWPVTTDTMSPLLSMRAPVSVNVRLLAACGVMALIAVVVAVSAGNRSPDRRRPRLPGDRLRLRRARRPPPARLRAHGRRRRGCCGSRPACTVAFAGLIATLLGQPTVAPDGGPLSQAEDAGAARYVDLAPGAARRRAARGHRRARPPARAARVRRRQHRAAAVGRGLRRAVRRPRGRRGGYHGIMRTIVALIALAQLGVGRRVVAARRGRARRGARCA